MFECFFTIAWLCLALIMSVEAGWLAAAAMIDRSVGMFFIVAVLMMLSWLMVAPFDLGLGMVLIPATISCAIFTIMDDSING